MPITATKATEAATSVVGKGSRSCASGKGDGDGGWVGAAVGLGDGVVEGLGDGFGIKI